MEKITKYIERAAKTKLPEITGIDSIKMEVSTAGYPIIDLVFTLDYIKLLERLGIHLTDEQTNLIAKDINTLYLQTPLIVAIKLNEEKFSNILKDFDYSIDKFVNHIDDLFEPINNILNKFLERFVDTYIPKSIVGKYEYILISYLAQ